MNPVTYPSASIAHFTVSGFSSSCEEEEGRDSSVDGEKKQTPGECVHAETAAANAPIVASSASDFEAAWCAFGRRRAKTEGRRPPRRRRLDAPPVLC